MSVRSCKEKPNTRTGKNSSRFHRGFWDFQCRIRRSLPATVTKTAAAAGTVPGPEVEGRGPRSHTLISTDKNEAKQLKHFNDVFSHPASGIMKVLDGALLSLFIYLLIYLRRLFFVPESASFPSGIHRSSAHLGPSWRQTSLGCVFYTCMSKDVNMALVSLSRGVGVCGQGVMAQRMPCWERLWMCDIMADAQALASRTGNDSHTPQVLTWERGWELVLWK